MGKRNQRKYVEHDEKFDEMCEKCCDAVREISKYVDISQGVAQGCTLSPDLFKIYIHDLIGAVEAAGSHGRGRYSSVGIDVCG